MARELKGLKGLVYDLASKCISMDWGGALKSLP